MKIFAALCLAGFFSFAAAQETPPDSSRQTPVDTVQQEIKEMPQAAPGNIPPGMPQRIIIDDVAAVVGDEIILSSEVKGDAFTLAQDRKINVSDTAAMRELTQDVLDNKISEKILLHNARQAKIEVADDQINEMVENQINELKSNYPSDNAFQQALAVAGQTLSGLKDYYREQAKNGLMQQNYLGQHRHEFPRVKVTEEEAQEFFKTQPISNRPDQVRYQRLIIAPQPSEEVLVQAKAKIDSIYGMYKSGTDFAYLAEKYSDDPSAAKGGDLGFFSKGDMVKEFEDSAFVISVGEVREVKTKYGWHLIRVEARRQKEVRVRHILAATQIKDADWERAYALADSLRNLVLKGESFYKLARKYGESASDLAESPAFTVMDKVPPAEQRTLQGTMTPVPGTSYLLSGIVEMKPVGYLLVLELERKEAAPLTYDEVHKQIIERLEYSKAIEAFVDKLRQKTYVDIRFKGWTPLPGGQ